MYIQIHTVCFIIFGPPMTKIGYPLSPIGDLWLVSRNHLGYNPRGGDPAYTLASCWLATRAVAIWTGRWTGARKMTFLTPSYLQARGELRLGFFFNGLPMGDLWVVMRGRSGKLLTV